VYVDNKEDHYEIVQYLKSLSPELVKRVTLYKNETPLFDHFDIEKELDRSLRRKVWLKNGGYLYFDHTEALLAIDINTGRNVGKKDLEDTIFQTNLAATQEICRQLRLRDIGGQIVVDFIDMRKTEHRRRIENEMRKNFEKDSTTVSHTGLSKFSLMEITRKRVRPELQELFTDICTTCNGLGRVFSPTTVTAQIDRLLRRAAVDGVGKRLQLSVPQSIADYLWQGANKILNDLKKSHGITLDVVVDETLDQDEFDVIVPGTQKSIAEKYS
jgi:ribonuclease G